MDHPPNEEIAMTVELLDALYALILLIGLIATILIAVGRGKEPIRLLGIGVLAVLAYLTVQFLDRLF
jgi:hypothetical protein